MIFLNRDQNSIWIPKHESSYGPMTLILKHNLTSHEYKFDGLTDVGSDTGYWIFYNINFSTLPSGEYTYNLNNIEVGLIQIIEPMSKPISYKSEKTIIQYHGTRK